MLRIVHESHATLRYQVRSLIAGQVLAMKTLQQQLDSGTHFSVAEIARIGTQGARGLGKLHRLPVLHRDIKPANLLQADNGDLRILDLGVSSTGD